MNDNRLTRQTYKNILGGGVDATSRNALGDIGNRLKAQTAAASLLNTKSTVFLSSQDEPSGIVKENVKITSNQTTTTTWLSSKIEQQQPQPPPPIQPEETVSKPTTTGNNSCIMLDAESSDVELEEEIDDHEDDEEEESEQSSVSDDVEDEWHAIEDDSEERKDVQQDKIVDIDQLDGDNPQLVSEYIKDIYKYLNLMERKYRVSATFLDGKLVTAKMRSVLIDWLIQVHVKFHLLQETLYLCVQIIDAYLQAMDVNKMNLQLVGVTAMFVASKYEEMYVPAIEDFVYMTDNTYTKSEIRQMEISILKTLNFMFAKPFPLHFLRRFSKAGQSDPKQHTLAKYFMEMSLHDAEFSSFDPSYLAACSLCLSFKMLDGPEWNNVMEHYSNYNLASLWPGMQKLAKLSLKAMEPDYKYRAATNKYASSKFMRISQLPELSEPCIKEIANGQFKA